MRSALTIEDEFGRVFIAGAIAPIRNDEAGNSQRCCIIASLHWRRWRDRARKDRAREFGLRL